MILTSKIDREHKNYRRERIYPFNLLALQAKQMVYVFGYTIKHVLYIDYIFQNDEYYHEILHERANSALKEYIKSHQIDQLYMSSTSDQSKEYLIQKGFELIDTTEELFVLKKSFQFA
jgi:hypothetical protein